MDCVDCDKCRLWGKLQTHGIGTALKILFTQLPLKTSESLNLKNFIANNPFNIMRYNFLKPINFLSEC